MKKYKVFCQTIVLFIGTSAFLAMFVLFFYTQNNARVLYRFKKNGTKVDAVVVAKQQQSFLGYRQYFITVKYSDGSGLRETTIQRFVSYKTFSHLNIKDTTSVLYYPNDQGAILFASTDKKNLRVTDKKTIVYILLIVGCVCFVGYSILGNHRL